MSLVCHRTDRAPHLTICGCILKVFSKNLHTGPPFFKFLKGTKIAGLAGGATSIAGGLAAAAAGVILSPVTAGTSLIAFTAVGVAAAGGLTRVSASIANQVN